MTWNFYYYTVKQILISNKHGHN